MSSVWEKAFGLLQTQSGTQKRWYEEVLGKPPDGLCHFQFLRSSIWKNCVCCTAYVSEMMTVLQQFRKCSISFLGWAPTSICHFFCPSVCPPVCCAPYLRNCTSSDHNFWYTYVKWWYLQGVFFNFFLILIFWAVRGVKGQKVAQKMKNNNYICHVLYLRNSVAYDHDFWFTCVKWWYLQVFFF